MTRAVTQTENDERRFGVTNNAAQAGAVAIAATLALWLVLFAAYRLDRAAPVAVATLTVLLVVPPLASYFALLEATRRTFSIAWQIFFVYLAALGWLVVQRGVLYPAFGFVPEVGENVGNFVLLPAFGIAAWFAARGLAYRRRLAKALALQAETELRLLEAQLAPHLLFNLLNTVYAVMLTDRDRALPLFLATTQMLRHVVERTRTAWVPLHEEVDFVRHYATLKRARAPDRVEIAIDAAGDLDVPVPPMLLATLFENAVKHGRFDDGALAVRVAVESGDDVLRLVVENRYPTVALHEAGLGIGLETLRRRLTLLYPQRGSLTVAADGGVFRATIALSP